ncbi:unnamed protein product [Adineta ricciae]|uniref:Costars domain-containing protein n=1 Tax=Adineta ricciae TaxID=249248 RepID=A0A815IIA5_ADIRI|nr:unnamed protein product [Adineta ricciae]CAF1536162.1 unnamed protein product [Adineta ricciae]
MASSSTEDVNEKDQKPKTRLVKCQPEFQKKLAEMHTPMPPPTPSSSSNQQGNEYNVLDEIKRIHQIVKNHGQQGDFSMEIRFGQLIPLYGNDQVDRLIEVLAIARKNGYVNYNLKDFFQQDRDEDIAIRLIKTRW